MYKLTILVFFLLISNVYSEVTNRYTRTYHRNYTNQYDTNKLHKAVVTNKLDQLDAELKKDNKLYSDHKTRLKSLTDKDLDKKVDKTDKTYMNCAEHAYHIKTHAERLGLSTKYEFSKNHVEIKVQEKGKYRIYSNGRRKI